MFFISFILLPVVLHIYFVFFFFFQAEDGIRDVAVTGVQTCALPIFFIFAWLCSRTRGRTRLPAVRLRWAISKTRRATLRVRSRTRSPIRRRVRVSTRTPSARSVASVG